MRNLNTTFSIDGNETVKSIYEATNCLNSYIARELEKLGMRASYRHLMKPLLDNESLTQLELVNITGLKAPTISITLRNMERDGIVRREKNDSDRRETHVFITPAGREMYEKLLAAIEKAQDIMVKNVNAKDLDTAKKVAEKMCANLLAELED